MDEVILARSYSAMPPDAPDAPETIMMMPGGVHQISAFRQQSGGGKVPVDAVVNVTPATAQALEDSRRYLVSTSRQLPFFDFDHAQDGPASGHPQAIFWSNTPEPGVYARVKWTASGARAIQGRDYRTFSASFRIDSHNPANVIGAPMQMGGLVNQAAFEKILPIWAGKSHQGEKMETSNENVAQLQEQLAAREAELIQAKAALDQAKNEASGIDALKATIAQLETESARVRHAQAQDCVNAAVARGVIAPKDEALKTRWIQLIESNTDHAVLLARLGSEKDFSRKTSTPAPTSADEQTRADRHSTAAREYQAKHACDFHSAWVATENQ